jgi:biotin--protein ligase
MAAFEALHARLCAGAGFPYELYYKHWLHRRQVVYLEAEQAKVCIEGIDEHGYLRARAVDEGLRGLLYPAASAARTFLLQPDGNSFDMMRKLIHRKAQL